MPRRWPAARWAIAYYAQRRDDFRALGKDRRRSAREADHAMYESKSKGRNRVALYEQLQASRQPATGSGS